MPTTFLCQNCGLEKPGNYRLVEQKYCSDLECQRARRREYQNNRRKEDAVYRQNETAYQNAWRRSSSARYQRAYRDAHPDYVEKNRQQQRERNRKRRAQEMPEASAVIVKMNSCSSIKSGTYLLTPCQIKAAEMIVKMNSCVVELSLFQQDASLLSAVARDCK
jgi:hypothetical protein